VIAPHNDSVELPDHINHLVGVCAVADDIAKVPNLIVVWRSGKDRL
jgi:hypothetical protein